MRRHFTTSGNNVLEHTKFQVSWQPTSFSSHYLIGRLDLTRFRLIWCQTLVTLQAGQRYELQLHASATGIDIWSAGVDSNQRSSGYEPDKEPLLYSGIFGARPWLRSKQVRGMNSNCTLVRLA